MNQAQLMIRDQALWMQWEEEHRRKTAVDYLHNLRVFESLYEEAVALGVLPPKAPLKRMGEKTRLAKALNVPTAAQRARSSS